MWRAGRLHGRVRRAFREGDVLDCVARNDRPHGLAVRHYRNGDTYVGYMEDGRRHGYGVYSWANGDSYEGNWVRGRMNGVGRKRMAGGDVLDGSFAANQAAGYCRKQFAATGDVHEGMYARDMRHGAWRAANPRSAALRHSYVSAASRRAGHVPLERRLDVLGHVGARRAERLGLPDHRNGYVERRLVRAPRSACARPLRASHSGRARVRLCVCARRRRGVRHGWGTHARADGRSRRERWSAGRRVDAHAHPAAPHAAGHDATALDDAASVDDAAAHDDEAAHDAAARGGAGAPTAVGAEAGSDDDDEDDADLGGGALLSAAAAEHGVESLTLAQLEAAEARPALHVSLPLAQASARGARRRKSRRRRSRGNSMGSEPDAGQRAAEAGRAWQQRRGDTDALSSLDSGGAAHPPPRA